VSRTEALNERRERFRWLEALGLTLRLAFVSLQRIPYRLRAVCSARTCTIRRLQSKGFSMRARLLAAVLACVSAHVSIPAFAQMTGDKHAAETLQVGQSLARFSLIQPATHLYLRYQVVAGARQTIDIWRRQINFEQQGDKKRMHITWRWDSVGERKFTSTRDYWFDRDTFRPITITRRLVEAEKTTVAGYEYLPDRIVGLADLPDNARKDFVQSAKIAPYAFETDMELLQALPLRSGYSVRIPFYEPGPGQPEPKFYTYTVVESDKINTPDNGSIDCWIVETSSDNPGYGATRFWLSKKTQVVIREETRLPDGSLFVKMLMTSDSDVG